MAGRFPFGGCLLMALACGAGVLAQEKPKEIPAPVAIPAEALKFGDALAEQAPHSFLRWANGYATKEMHEQNVNPRGTMEVVDRRYPKTSDTARDCGVFLLFHLAYKDEDARAVVLESEIREIDRETYDLTRDLQVLYENEQSRLASIRGGIGPQQRVQMQERIDRMNERLRELKEKRGTKVRLSQESRKKVSLYLKVAAVTHERMKGIPATAIRELQ